MTARPGPVIVSTRPEAVDPPLDATADSRPVNSEAKTRSRAVSRTLSIISCFNSLPSVRAPRLYTRRILAKIHTPRETFIIIVEPGGTC